MIINDCSWDKFLKKENGKPIVCFGAGMMPGYIEPLWEQIGIWKNIVCFLDNNIEKSGILVGKSQKKIVMTLNDFLQKLVGMEEFCLVITCETFDPIVKQLNKIKELDKVECYIYPLLNKSYFDSKRCNTLIESGLYETIPRKIHYCWFGKNEMGPLQKMCLESWKRICPDYEIICWNEENYNVEKNLYIKQAYEKKKWAFVSDYVRLDVLFEYGGIYVDTDVELIKSIDFLLKQQAFIAYGEWPALNSGAGIGSVKGNSIIKEMRDNPRAKLPFTLPNGECNLITNSIYESAVLQKYGLVQDFQMQKVGGMLILPPDYFAPESVLGADAYISERTLAIHHCIGSWADDKRKSERKMTQEASQENIYLKN